MNYRASANCDNDPVSARCVRIAEAKQRGVKFGRPSIVTEEIVTKLRQRRAKGVKIKTLMEDYGLSKTSVYRYLADA